MKLILFLTSFISCQALNFTSIPTLEITKKEDKVTTRPPLLASTEQGLVQGITLRAANEETVTAFLGIPFAKAPIEDLRFKPPQDHLPWNGVRKANRQPPSCMQMPDLFFADFKGAQESLPATAPSEDCLYLNIFIPDIKVRVHKGGRLDKDANLLKNGLPVLIWLHGGEFTSGSSLKLGPQDENWSPDPRELASSGKIIVITMHYRLGTFGFLFLDDPEAPGNVGLLDVQKGLKWVQRNILAFGGDPNRVTLAGQDSGGSLALMLKTLEQETLFHRLILHSAGIQHPWSFVEPREAFKRSLSLAALVGCPTSGSRKDVIECLKSKSPDELVFKEHGVVHNPGLNFRPFVPTADGEIIKLEPKEMLPRVLEKFEKFSILLGTNGNEGSKSAMYFLPNSYPNEEMDQKKMPKEAFDEAIEKIGLEHSEEIIELIRFQYTNWSHINDQEEIFNQVLDLLGDHQYTCPVNYLAQALADRSEMFKYLFNVKNPLDQWPQWTGVKHGDEMDYIFGRPLYSNDPLFTLEHKEISRFMTEAWSNFVKYGNPNGASRASHQIGWPRYTNGSKHVLKISTFVQENLSFDGSAILSAIVHEDKAEACAFWNDLVPRMQNLPRKPCFVQQPVQKDPVQFLPLTSREVETTTEEVIDEETTTFQPESEEESMSFQQKIEEESTTFPQNTEEESIFDKRYQVSFRMSVGRPEQPKDWKFYNAPGNDPILLAREEPKTTTSSTTTLRSTSPSTTTMRPTFPSTIMRTTVGAMKRKPTWKPNMYDPFSRFPYFRMDLEEEKKRDSSMYYPM